MNTRVIKKIIERLDKEPQRVITSSLGSGCHARKFGDSNLLTSSYKVVIPGDTFAAAKDQLHYLLFDLGIDVGLSTEEMNEGELI